MKCAAKFTIKFNRLFLFIFFFIYLSLATIQFAHAKSCQDFWGHDYTTAVEKKFSQSVDVSQALIDFAEKHNLPVTVLDVGPEERKVKRIFVPVDVSNEALLTDYYNTFNLATPLAGKTTSTFPIEIGKDQQNSGKDPYVSLVGRMSSNPEVRAFRGASYSLEYSNWFSNVQDNPRFNPSYNQNVFGFAHLIGVNPQEAQSVQNYVDYSFNNRSMIAPLKSDNCSAWCSSVELGVSTKEATTEERRHLFTVLGMSRTVAHFEAGRRLIHAANQRHGAVVVFVKNAAGAEEFTKNPEQYLPPLPQTPLQHVIKDFEFKESPAVEAVKKIADGSKVFIPIAAGASPEGMAALAEYAKILNNGLDVHVLVNGISENIFRKAVDETDGKLRIHALFLGSNLRKLYHEGKVAVIPGNLSDFTRSMRDPTVHDFDYDAIVVRVAPADEQGRYSLGPNNDMIMTIIKNRPDIKIIAEVNKNVPRTAGENFITENQMVSKFDSDTQLAGPAVVPLTDVEVSIGKSLAALVEDNATLQIGIGNIFGGLAQGLKDLGRKGLKIFTEMFGDAQMEMMNMGLVRGKAKAGFAYGTQALYQWLNGNQNVVFEETEFVNDPGKVAKINGFHAINTALQINLYGEVNATMGPDGRMSSPGGQVEFMTGAARSPGGKAIIAIRSTAKGGEISTISLDLYRGPITTPHESVSHVVTEYGIATLRGKSERERAIALIKIAHPNFRNELALGALERGLITQKDVDLFN